jgi:alpha-1,2-mannosyltransferase
MMNLQGEADPALRHDNNAAQESEAAETGRLPLLRRPRLRELVVFLVFSILIYNVASFLIPHPGMPGVPRRLEPNSLAYPTIFIMGVRWTDSLGPMLWAIHFLKGDPHGPIYQKIFFEDRIKFQYPLTSLLPYYELEHWGVGDGKLFRLSRIIIDLTFLLTILVSVLLAFWLMAKRFGAHATRREKICAGVSLGIAGLAFNPLISCAVVGQIQTLLTLGFTLAFVCWMAGMEAWAGAILGVMMLVKPQYAVFLLWALVRRKFSAAAAALICSATGFAASCAVFGLKNNLEYIRVLQFIGRRGESYYPNQSINGILNRLQGHANFLEFQAKQFAPENSFVFWGTMLSTLVLLLLAIFYPWGKRRSGGAGDFACILLVSTMASPIAWNHHYAILFPIFVWLWFDDYAWRKSRWDRFLIAVAYFLTSNMITPLMAMTNIPGWNILTSNLFFGAVLALVLLLRSETGAPDGSNKNWAERKSSREPNPVVASPAIAS